MTFKNHILQVLQMIQPCKLTQTFKISSFFLSSTTPNPTCTNPVVFFFLDIPFHLFWMIVFDTRSSKSSFLKISDLIWIRSWNAFIKAWSSRYLFRAEVPEVLIFFEEIKGLDLYIRSGPNCIIVFDTWRKYQSSCFSFCASFLASLSLFLFLASCFLFSTSFSLKTQALWPSNQIPVCCACRFFCISAIKSSVLVQFRTILLAITSLAILKILYKRSSLRKSNVWCQNSDISSWISITCSIFPGIYGMAPEKNCIYKSLLEPAQVLSVLEVEMLFACTKSFWNTTVGLYGISSVARQADSIFREILPCRLAFCINEIKLALSILYVVKRVFLDKSFL